MCQEFNREACDTSHTIVNTTTAANMLPPMLAPKTFVTEEGNLDTSLKEKSPSTEKPVAKQGQMNELFTELDLSDLDTWDPSLQEETKSLIKEYAHIFLMGDMDLGKTSVIKHMIKVTDPIPFNDRYRRIPLHMFEEVRKHLKEMMEIGAIRKSNSSWASTAVLVRIKDGSLSFCLDLRRFNARTVKDAYTLPRIVETLDCLNGAELFSALNLKSRYWQVELDEESMPLTAFTVGLLGFYEGERIPFVLANTPATFQRLNGVLLRAPPSQLMHYLLE